jgi:hypothetical protein
MILAEKQACLGNRWAEIAKFLRGRTDTLVKNRWNTSVKARTKIDSRGKITVCPVRFGDSGSETTASSSNDNIEKWLDELNQQRPSSISAPSPNWIPPLLPKSELT